MIKLLIVEDELITRRGLMRHIPWKKIGVDMVETAEKVMESLRIHVRMREVRILQAKILQITRMVVVRISQIKITAEEKIQ